VTISLREALAAAAARLRDAGIENPQREARRLAAHAAGTTATGLLAFDTIDEHALAALVARRAAHEPLAFITGQREFWGLAFAVSPATLIPRPDSETLIELALAHRPAARVLDLGTGTGCLLLSLLHEWPESTGVGVDLSPAAAALAARNAAALGLASRAGFLAGHWADALATCFDLVISNPPYIESGEIPGLMPDVAAYEPATALDGGADGLAAYRAILAALPGLLAPNGAAILEIGATQAPAVTALAAAAGYAAAARADLAGHPRALRLTPAK
jgi:release factor glutamine methyltransferase